jgi:6-phosphogluconolactonase
MARSGTTSMPRLRTTPPSWRWPRGPKGHVASLFPEAPAMYDDRSVVPVRGCPKPPSTRISLSLSTINRSRETWVIAAGEEKAGAARLALSGAGPTAIPAAGVRGKVATRWLLDRAAASRLPSALARLASP